MNILVTVGTTRFDALVEEAKLLKTDDVFIQHANPKLESDIHNGVTFANDIQRYYQQADLIICHAGAGTVYHLLELGFENRKFLFWTRRRLPLISFQIK